MTTIQIIHIVAWTFAPFYDAVCDTLADHFIISIFKNLNPKWWQKSVSFLYVKPFLGWVRLDGWHVAKFLKLGCLAVAAVTYANIFTVFDKQENVVGNNLSTIFNILLNASIHLIYGGIIFELFYSYILANKKNFYNN